MTDQAARHKVLFMAPNYACGGEGGGSQRTDLLYRSLLEKFDVDVLITGSAISEHHIVAFTRSTKIFRGLHSRPSDFGAWKWIKFLVPKQVDKIATAFMSRRLMYNPDSKMTASLSPIDWRDYDLIIGRYFRSTARTGVLDLAHAPPVLLDVDDRDDLVLEAQERQQSANPIVSALLRNHIRQVEAIMAAKLPHAAHLWIASEDDRDGLHHQSISVLPNIPYYPAAPHKPSPPVGDPVIFFVGGAGHPPNLNGVQHFVHKCWPAIHSALSNARFRIVGGGWERIGKRLGSIAGVDIVGRIDDLSDEYARASLAISPINEGGGTKIKVLEALNFGVPIVASKHSARGFSPQLQSEGIFVAATDQEMIDHCVKLLRAPELAQDHLAHGQAIVRQDYSYERFRGAVLAPSMAALSGDARQSADVEAARAVMDSQNGNILLMTSTIAPGLDTFALLRSDPKLRLNDYVASLQFYLKTLRTGVADMIVYVDNSGHPLTELEAAAADAGMTGRVEFISYKSEIPPRSSRFYLEGHLLLEALARSKILRDAGEKTIWKITGRYIIDNIDAIIRDQPKEFDLYVNMKNIPSKWVDLFLMGCRVDALKHILADRIEEYSTMKAGEAVLSEKISAGAFSDLKIVRRFRHTPRVFGIRGFDNTSYHGFGHSLKFRFRSVMNRVFPWLWI